MNVFARWSLLLVPLGTGLVWAGEKPQPQPFASQGVAIHYTAKGAGSWTLCTSRRHL